MSFIKFIGSQNLNVSKTPGSHFEDRGIRNLIERQHSTGMAQIAQLKDKSDPIVIAAEVFQL
jgi:hypothetical protein